MKNWLNQHKKAIIISEFLTCLPMALGLLLWNYLPDTMLIHWSGGGAADGAGTKAFAVFGMPLILAALNLLCLLGTGLDKRVREQNSKAFGILFWLMPVISLVCCGFIYAAAMGKAMDVSMVVPVLLGVLFLVIGNYMPKIKQNASFGIKCIWTLSNEENWNKTHRFAGKVWVAAGVVILLTVVLPFVWSLVGTCAIALIAALAPMVYSYRIYKEHKAKGTVYFSKEIKQEDKKRTTIGIVMSAVVLVIVAVLMFTGDIAYTFDADALQIKAGWSEDLSVAYDKIDELQLREDFDFGVRLIGFNSVRLSTGTFQNEALGEYTLYAYNGCNTVILIRSGEARLVINAKTAEETKALYESLLTKIG